MSEEQNEWTDQVRTRQATYSEMQDWLVKTLDENTALRRQLDLRGDTSSFEFRGLKIIVSPTTPPFVWDGKTISVLDASPKAEEEFHVRLLNFNSNLEEEE
jgi:hypothetical protein